MNFIIQTILVILASLFAVVGILLLGDFMAFYGALFCILAVGLMKIVINDIAEEKK